jgi:hypothetical protein
LVACSLNAVNLYIKCCVTFHLFSFLQCKTVLIVGLQTLARVNVLMFSAAGRAYISWCNSDIIFDTSFCKLLVVKSSVPNS